MNTQENKKNLSLIQGQSIYKMIVPENVEEKIRYLIRKFPSTEWSGILFYTHQGTFEENNLTITCQDIFPMDLGTSGWTEFKMSEDVAAYMAENIELFDYEMGLIHSHHIMGAFFSGQDNQMLQQEGEDTNCFVSLIVDTKGTYKARITRKVQTKSEVTVKGLGTSYEFFGEGTKSLSPGVTEGTKIIEKQVIEYFDLDVERHIVENSLDYLDRRFEEIQKNKNSKSNNIDNSTFYYIKDKVKETSDEWLHNITKEEKSEKSNTSFDMSLFKGETQKKRPTWDYTDIEWFPDPKKVHEAVVHILTCSLIMNPAKFDMKQWIEKSMAKVYSRIFNDGGGTTHTTSYFSMYSFSEWRDFILQFTLDNLDFFNVPESLMDDIELVQSRIAQSMYLELQEFIDVNLYISAYCEDLCKYIIE